MQADREIVSRYFELFRNVLRRFTIEIDAPDELRIVPTEAWKEPVKAGTHGAPSPHPVAAPADHLKWSILAEMA